MSYLSNSDKIKIEMALRTAIRDLNKNNIHISSVNTALRQIGMTVDELPKQESCQYCGFLKESVCLECDNV